MILLVSLIACTQPQAVDDETDDTLVVDTDSGPHELTVVGLNCESGESVAETVAEEVVTPQRGEALWGFSEVASEAYADTLVAAAADDADQRWDYVKGTTGLYDRLVIAWDEDVMELLSYEELHDINIRGTARAPLVGHMRHKPSGTELLFMVNHLWRTDDAARHEQAALLNAWGAAQTLPVIAVGDYNFDWDVPSDGEDYQDAGYALMTEDGVFTWVRPEPLARTQCAWSYESVLDFTFAGGDARQWPATSVVHEIDNHYCDSNQDERSDHMPVEATFTLP